MTEARPSAPPEFAAMLSVSERSIRAWAQVEQVLARGARLVMNLTRAGSTEHYGSPW